MAKEGIPFVAIPLAAGVILLLLHIRIFSPLFAAVLFLAALGFAFFFRDPRRAIHAGASDIVSPVDGTVMAVSDEGEVRRITVFLSIFNVHVIRLPYAGTLKKIEYFKGQFLPAYRDKASELNERVTLSLASGPLAYSLRLIAGIAARRIRLWVKEGAPLQTGQKIGIILFGSRAELLLPKSVRVLVSPGDTLTGGITFVGNISHPD